MRKVKVCASSRCFFPKGAFFYSTNKLAGLAKEVGYEGIEFLPTWRVCWEAIRYGELLTEESMVASLHRDWRFDRVMEAKRKGKPSWLYQFREKADWLFPPSSVARRALQKLQDRYMVPVSVAWFEDTKCFSPVMLELWSKDQGIDKNGLMRWLKKGANNHGVVIDTAKYTGWLKSNNLLDQREEVLEELIPHTFEVHYRGVKKGLRRTMSIGEELSDDSSETLRLILKKGYQGRIVVEFGWPDLEDSPFGLFSEDLDAFKKLHHQIISLIKGI